MASLAEVTRLMGVLAAAFPNAPKLDKGNFQTYHLILGDLPYTIIEAAGLQLAADNGRFYPTAGEIRGAAVELLARAEGVPSAEDAWAEITRSFHSHGYYRGAPDWSHPLIGKAIDAMGGYTELCVSENAIADRAHFFKIYASLQQRHRSDAALLPDARRLVEQLAAEKRLQLGSG